MKQQGELGQISQYATSILDFLESLSIGRLSIAAIMAQAGRLLVLA